MQLDSKKFVYDLVVIRNNALRTVAESSDGVTPSALEKTLIEAYGLDKKRARFVIRELVEAGELAYVYEHGRTLLEVSYRRPVRVSQRLVLKPPRCSYRPRPGEVVVQIQAGASFGAGRHPTTRLALGAIDVLFARRGAPGTASADTVLDVGTGTGVLVIAAVLLGARRGLGLDIDACARAEAAANVAANNLEERIAICAQAVEGLKRQFSLITANLRSPSLIRLAPVLAMLCAEPGALVLSGIQQAEQQPVLDAYADQGFAPAGSHTGQGWAALILQQQGP